MTAPGLRRSAVKRTNSSYNDAFLKLLFQLGLYMERSEAVASLNTTQYAEVL